MALFDSIGQVKYVFIILGMDTETPADGVGNVSYITGNQFESKRV